MARNVHVAVSVQLTSKHNTTRTQEITISHAVVVYKHCIVFLIALAMYYMYLHVYMHNVHSTIVICTVDLEIFV